MFLGRDGFVWWIGVVEDNNDPLLLCRVKVRIFGYHPKYVAQSTTVGDTNNLVPTDDLPWATVVISPNTSTLYSRLELGDFVLGFFLDGVEAQEPAVFGVIPTPLKAGQVSTQFGKHARTKRSFGAVTTSSNELPIDSNYNLISATKVIESERGHKIALIDDDSANKLTLFHKDGTFLDLNKNSVDIFGKDSITLRGTGSARIVIRGSDILVQGDLGTYNLIDQLQWISEVTHTTTGGGKRGPRNFTIGTRANPGPSGGGGGGGGGGCFTGETLVSMWDGSNKRIDEIRPGDLVQSGMYSKPSKVLFVEKLPDNILWNTLYSPSENHTPFATPNHMLFVNKEWVAHDIDIYDWMPKLKRVQNPITTQPKGDFVYNLWLEGGDGTYFVNGYLTHSILYDGGFMRLAWEKGFLSHEQIMGLLHEFTIQGKKMIYGSYLINKIVGKINQKHWIKFISHIMKKEETYMLRKAMVFSMKCAASTMMLINNIKEKLNG
jgi:hypothetical protein